VVAAACEEPFGAVGLTRPPRPDRAGDARQPAQAAIQLRAIGRRPRAEPFPLERVPMGCVLLLASVDTQDNRLECAVWGYGRGCETWTIAHRIFFGNPSEESVWEDLEDFLFHTEFPHASGKQIRIHASAIDSGGHNTQAVYHWVSKHSRRRVYAIKGRGGREKAIKDGAGKVDIDWRGRVRRHGLVLWHVGTNHAKDMIHGRLQISRPGPGYIHFSRELSDEWFRQFTGEARTTRRSQRGDESVWTPTRKRIEAWDCAVYAAWLEAYFDLGKKSAKFWSDLEEQIQPANGDLFAETKSKEAAPVAQPEKREPSPLRQVPQKPARASGFAKGWKR